MWEDDYQGYFTSRSARYLEYNNDRANVTTEEEIRALKNAFRIANATDRIVILPELHCAACAQGFCNNGVWCAVLCPFLSCPSCPLCPLVSPPVASCPVHRMTP
jgi:hypothetical protein